MRGQRVLKRPFAWRDSFQNTQLAGFQAVLADSNWDISRCTVIIDFEGRHGSF